MLIILLFVFIIFLCWGSFLNLVAYRIGANKTIFTKRSKCPHCDKVINWYDNIPIISFIILKAKCRFCKHKISYLYPFIELLTGILITFLFYKIFIIKFGLFTLHEFFFTNVPLTLSACEAGVSKGFISYFIFFSALIINIRTDLENMVISQLFSIYLVPLGLILAYFNFTQISFKESLLGAFVGYFSLWLIAKLFKFFAKKEGLGVGDMELLAMIGSFLGPLGIYFSVLIGSITGLIFGLIYLLVTKKDKQTPFPFGPFLSLGALFYFFFFRFLH